MNAITDPAKLMTEPLEVYLDEKAENAYFNSVGAFVVLNGAQRVEYLRKKSLFAKVPCLGVSMPLSADDYFVRATSANKKSEIVRTATFSTEWNQRWRPGTTCRLGARRPHQLHSSKKAANREMYALRASVQGSEDDQVLKTS